MSAWCLARCASGNTALCTTACAPTAGWRGSRCCARDASSGRRIRGIKPLRCRCGGRARIRSWVSMQRRRFIGSTKRILNLCNGSPSRLAWLRSGLPWSLSPTFMNPINRRSFLTGSAAAGVLTWFRPLTAEVYVHHERGSDEAERGESEKGFNDKVDFRFAPQDFQSTICFPDDPAKTVIGKYGDLRYDFPDDRLA